jgi:hypothetical protein
LTQRIACEFRKSCSNYKYAIHMSYLSPTFIFKRILPLL